MATFMGFLARIRGPELSARRSRREPSGDVPDSFDSMSTSKSGILFASLSSKLSSASMHSSSLAPTHASCGSLKSTASMLDRRRSSATSSASIATEQQMHTDDGPERLYRICRPATQPSVLGDVYAPGTIALPAASRGDAQARDAVQRSLSSESARARKDEVSGSETKPRRSQIHSSSTVTFTTPHSTAASVQDLYVNGDAEEVVVDDSETYRSGPLLDAQMNRFNHAQHPVGVSSPSSSSHGEQELTPRKSGYAIRVASQRLRSGLRSTSDRPKTADGVRDLHKQRVGFARMEFTNPAFLRRRLSSDSISSASNSVSASHCGSALHAFTPPSTAHPAQLQSNGTPALQGDAKKDSSTIKVGQRSATEGARANGRGRTSSSSSTTSSLIPRSGFRSTFLARPSSRGTTSTASSPSTLVRPLPRVSSAAPSIRSMADSTHTNPLYACGRANGEQVTTSVYAASIASHTSPDVHTSDELKDTLARLGPAPEGLHADDLGDRIVVITRYVEARALADACARIDRRRGSQQSLASGRSGNLEQAMSMLEDACAAWCRSQIGRCRFAKEDVERLALSTAFVEARRHLKLQASLWRLHEMYDLSGVAANGPGSDSASETASVRSYGVVPGKEWSVQHALSIDASAGFIASQQPRPRPQHESLSPAPRCRRPRTATNVPSSLSFSAIASSLALPHPTVEEIDMRSNDATQDTAMYMSTEDDDTRLTTPVHKRSSSLNHGHVYQSARSSMDGSSMYKDTVSLQQQTPQRGESALQRYQKALLAVDGEDKNGLLPTEELTEECTPSAPPPARYPSGESLQGRQRSTWASVPSPQASLQVLTPDAFSSRGHLRAGIGKNSRSALPPSSPPRRMTTVAAHSPYTGVGATRTRSSSNHQTRTSFSGSGVPFAMPPPPSTSSPSS